MASDAAHYPVLLIENNIVAGNARGFFIYDAEYNVIRNNLVADNTIGVHRP